MQLHQAIVALTGASGDIGRAVRGELAGRGAVVKGCSLNGGDDTAAVDLRDGAAVERWLASIVKEEGRIDLLVHCAGSSEQPSSVAAMDPRVFSDILETNVTGVFNVLHSALPLFQTQGGGSVLVIASRAARKPHPGLPAYSAAKAAVLALCLSCAKKLEEEASPVRLAVVSPSGVQGSLRSRLFGEASLEGVQTPGDLAAVIADIAEEKTQVPHGSDVIVDKGAITEIIPPRA